MASIFGKKNDLVSKSWGDLWDEEMEEEEDQVKARQMQNARTWSHESKSEDDTIRPEEPLELERSSFVNITKLTSEAVRGTANDIDGDLIADGFFFQNTPKEPIVQESFGRYSPPSKRTNFDKWTALGERRRRAYTGTSESEKSPDPWKARRNVGLGFTGFGVGVWDNKANNVTKDKGKACPWARDQVRDHNVGKEKRHGREQFQWVEGTMSH